MAHANKVEGILIGVDELLDTRLGTLGKLSPQVAHAVVASNSYHKREMDCFDGINDIVYKDAYATRDKLTLTHSVMTGIIEHLRGLLKQLKDQALTQPFHDAVRVYVNTYPYAFSDEEKNELGRVVLYRLNGGVIPEVQDQDLVSVEIINTAPDLLTPAHCKATFGAMYMYDPWTWMNLHSDAFKTVRLPEVILYAPRIYFNRKPSDEELEELKHNAPDPFTSIEMHSSPIVGLTLIEVVNFSSSVRLQIDQAA